MRGQGQDPKRKAARASQATDDVVVPFDDDAAIAAGTAAGSGAAQGDTGGVEEDPTLDVVRQLIAEAEALPEPEPVPEPDPAPVPIAQPPRAFADFAADVAEDWDDDGEPWDEASGDWDYDQPAEAWEEDAGLDAGSDGARRGLLGRAFAALGRGLWAVLRAGLRWIGAGLRWMGRRVWAFLRRPDAPRWLAVAVIAAAAIVWPWFVLKISLLFPLGLVTLWAATGNKGFAELVVKWYDWFKARDPDKAKRLRRAAAWTSRTIMRGVDRLPSHWTTGFSLPDFEGSVMVPEKMKVDPFEDFAARVHASKQGED